MPPNTKKYKKWSNYSIEISLNLFTQNQHNVKIKMIININSKKGGDFMKKISLVLVALLLLKSSTVDKGYKDMNLFCNVNIESINI